MSKRLVKLQEEKANCNNIERLSSINSEIVKELEIGRRETLKKDPKRLNDVKFKKGKIAAIFNLKETLVGKKKVGQEATSLLNPVTNKEIHTIDEIKQVSLQYCKDLLTNRFPRDGYVKILEDKYRLHELRMNEIVSDDIVLTDTMLNQALQRLKSKHPHKYQFILKG